MKRSEKLAKLKAVKSLREERAMLELTRVTDDVRRLQKRLEETEQGLAGKEQEITDFARDAFLSMTDGRDLGTSFMSIALGTFKRRRELSSVRIRVARDRQRLDKLIENRRERASIYMAASGAREMAEDLCADALATEDAAAGEALEEEATELLGGRL